jgi:hypothetical protein
MGLTSKQRNALPNQAFAYPAKRLYPVPTKGQARKAGISEAQRQRTLSAAKSFAGRKATRGTVAHVRRVANRRR